MRASPESLVLLSSLGAGLRVFVHAVADMLHNTCHSLIHGHAVLLLVAAETERNSAVLRILTASNQNERNLLSRRSTDLLREAVRTVIHLNTHAVGTQLIRDLGHVTVAGGAQLKLADEINVKTVNADTFKAGDTVMNNDGVKVGDNKRILHEYHRLGCRHENAALGG